jgi:hypothetical protein
MFSVTTLFPYFRPPAPVPVPPGSRTCVVVPEMALIKEVRTMHNQGSPYRSVCSWFPSVSGSESGSGSIPTGIVGGPHARCSPAETLDRCTVHIRFLVSKSHLLSFDSDSDSDTDPDDNPIDDAIGTFRPRDQQTIELLITLPIRLLLVPIGVGVGIGIGIDSDRYCGWSSRKV